jgi:hypothetical protein
LQLRQRALGGRAFVFGTKVCMLHAQSLQTQSQGRTVPPRDDHRRDASPLKQLDAMAIQRVETFDRFALLAHQQATVGQNAIDIEKRHPNTLGLQQQLG